MMKLEPAFQFNGDCAQAMSFYADLFGGSIEVVITRGNSPMSANVPPGYEEKLMHSSVRFGDYLIMGSDALPGRYISGSTVTVSIAVSTVENGQRIFDALAQDGKILMPFQIFFG